MFGRPKDADRVVESRARDRARWAIRDHGDGAEDFIRAKLRRPSLNAADRLLHRLTLREIAVVRRERVRATQIVAMTPGPFAAMFKFLFGARKRRKRRR